MLVDLHLQSAPVLIMLFLGHVLQEKNSDFQPLCQKFGFWMSNTFIQITWLAGFMMEGGVTG